MSMGKGFFLLKMKTKKTTLLFLNKYIVQMLRKCVPSYTFMILFWPKNSTKRIRRMSHYFEWHEQKYRKVSGKKEGDFF